MINPKNQLKPNYQKYKDKLKMLKNQRDRFSLHQTQKVKNLP